MYKELVEYVVKCLVENKDKVEVTEELIDDKQVITIKVDTADMGRVIGKEGRIIKSIREIVHSFAAKDNKKAVVNVAE